MLLVVVGVAVAVAVAIAVVVHSEHCCCCCQRSHRVLHNDTYNDAFFSIQIPVSNTFSVTNTLISFVSYKLH